MVNENKLYTAYITGTSQDGNKEYERVIITKWKDRTDESSEEGSKIYYFNADYNDIEELIYNETWCKRIYATYPQNTRLWIEKEIKCHVGGN